MCDCLIALPSATDQPFALFAKNSDRPPDERQVVEWNPSRRNVAQIRATHIDVAPFDGDTIGCLISRPEWCWGAEHGVNEAGVAIGNEAIYTTMDPRGAPPALIGMDLVRLGLERGESAQQAVEVITSLLERYGRGGTGHDDRFVRCRASPSPPTSRTAGRPAARSLECGVGPSPRDVRRGGRSSAFTRQLPRTGVERVHAR